MGAVAVSFFGLVSMATRWFRRYKTPYDAQLRAVEGVLPAELAPVADELREQEEGVRVLTELVDCAPSDLEIDMPVEVVFDQVTPEITLPKFRKA